MARSHYFYLLTFGLSSSSLTPSSPSLSPPPSPSSLLSPSSSLLSPSLSSSSSFSGGRALLLEITRNIISLWMIKIKRFFRIKWGSLWGAHRFGAKG
jgi:hypothetical protein